MTIKLNGKNEEIDSKTIYDLIVSKGLKPKSVVVEYNYKIVKMDQWKDTMIKENDNLEVLSFVEGG